MRFLRKNRRRLAALAAVGAIGGLAGGVVLPALASNPGDLVGPAAQPSGVYPVDVQIGGNSNCSNLFGFTTGVSQYLNNNPKTGTGIASGNNDGVTFDLTMSTGKDKDKFLIFTAHGAAVLGVGINGGTENAAYNYKTGTAAGFVKADGQSAQLHAPAQDFTSTTTTSTTGSTVTVESGTQWYSISHIAICYTPVSFIEGTVYKDADQSGTLNAGTPADSVFANADNWKVRLYKNGTQIDEQPTVSGKYHFDLPVDGSTYRVCEVPGSTSPAPGDTWVQSQPNPATASICGSGTSPKGYEFKPTGGGGQSNDDFGNVGGFSCDSAGASLGTGNYTVGICKGDQQYVFNSGTIGSGTLAGTPFVDYWVGDPSQANKPTVEQINFADPTDPDTGLPVYNQLLYADGGGFPVQLNNLKTMPSCKLDPRDTTNASYPASFALSSSYDELSESAAVLPGSNTSCVISIKTTSPVPPATVGQLQAYVYALGDSGRLPQ